MNEERRARVALAFAAAAASWCAMLGMTRLVLPGGWIYALLFVCIVVAATGLGVHRLTRRRILIVPAQLLATVLAVTFTRVPGSAIGYVLPGSGALQALHAQLIAAGTDMRQYAPPAPATPGITTLLVLAGAGIALLVDVLAVSYRKAAVAGLPLLAVYLVPATRAPGGFSWLAFAVAAAPYLGLVGIEGRERLGRWGRAVGGRSGGVRPGSAPNPHAGVSRRIAVSAIAAALVVPVFLPTLPGIVPSFAGGPGIGGFGGEITIIQSVDLRASLISSTPYPLLNYTTNASGSDLPYLLMSIDDDFDGDKWTSSESAGGTSNPKQPIHDSQRTADTPTTTVTTTVKVIGSLGFNNVPAPYPVQSLSSNLPITSLDPNTMAIWTSGSPSTQRYNDKYDVASTLPEPSYKQLEDVPPLIGTQWQQKYLDLPQDLLTYLQGQAQTIVGSATTEIAKAYALQNYFSTSGGFTYSTSVGDGTGTSAIKQFLTSKRGFCEQYAATMAAMARALGIPAVVAVGFTPGTEQSDGSYLVTSHDAHAWPMLFFPTIGWLRFEPTPVGANEGGGQVPTYSQPGSAVQQNPTAQASDAGQATPTAKSSVNACSPQNLANAPHPLSAPGGPCSSRPATAAASVPFASLGAFGAVPRWFQRWFLTGSPAQIALKLLALLALCLAVIPAFGRLVRRRRRRLLIRQAERYLKRAAEQGAAAGPDGGPPVPRSGSRRRNPVGPAAAMALAAWEELREYADDLGYPHQESDTLRQTAHRLAEAAEFDEPARAAIGRVTTLTEQARYGAVGLLDQPALHTLPADLRSVRGALAGHADRSARIMASIMPASSLARLRDRFQSVFGLRRRPDQAPQTASATSDQAPLDSSDDPSGS